MANKDITLVLKVDNTQYVQNIKKAQEETQALYDKATRGRGKLTGAIEKEQAVLKSLQDYKKKAAGEDLKYANQEIEASKKRLELYQKSGQQVEQTNNQIAKSGGGMLSSIKSWALGFATVTAAIEGFKAIIESTDTLSDKFAATLGGWKEGFAAMARAIANDDFKDFFKNVKEAVKEGQRYVQEQDKIEDNEIKMRIKIAEAETKIQELRYTSVTDKDLKKRVEAGKEAERLTREAAQMRLDLANMVYENDIKHAASIAGFREDEIDKGKELVRQYLLQNEELLRQIEIGKEYNALQSRLKNLNTPVGGTAPPSAAQIQANIDEQRVIQAKLKALGQEGVEYGRLAIGMGNLTIEFRQKIAADEEAIEVSKQSAFNLRLGSRNAAAEAKATKEGASAKKSIIEDYDKWFLDNLEAQSKLANQLRERYAKANIASLTGPERLKAEYDFAVAEIDNFKKQLLVIGQLTPEQEKMFEFLGAQAKKAFIDGLEKEAMPEEEASSIFTRFVDKLTNKGIQKPTVKPREKKSIWDVLGIDTETDEGKRQQQALEDAATKVKTVIDEVYQKRVEDAQRRRELLDTQISEAQAALTQEIELQKNGYASNVEGKKKEVADLKVARDNALKQEQAALKQQRAIDTAAQISSLITAVANIFSKESKLGTIGIILAIASVATMFGSFLAAKQQAKSAAGYYKGGWTGDGYEKDLSGHRVAGVVHEKEFVVKKGAAAKYRSVLEAINKDERHELISKKLVEISKERRPDFAINKINPEIFHTTVNNINIDNSGQNSRLDKVNSQLERLNKNKESVLELDGATVYIKGNSKRIVRGSTR